MSRPPRNVWKAIVVNFIESLKPRQFRGNHVGTDVLGNKYYEIPAAARRGHNRPSRWYEPVIKEDCSQELPSEWQSWLRGRRKVPPTEEEIAENTRIMLLKKENALLLEEENKSGKLLELAAPKTGIDSFPSYGNEYEYIPGSQQKK